VEDVHVHPGEHAVEVCEHGPRCITRAALSSSDEVTLRDVIANALSEWASSRPGDDKATATSSWPRSANCDINAIALSNGLRLRPGDEHNYHFTSIFNSKKNAIVAVLRALER
jgi:hypothetical protein